MSLPPFYGVKTENPGPHPIEATVSLNEILQRALQIFRERCKVDLILRCENLPLVKVDPEQGQRLFSLVLEMVVGEGPPGPRQFLYIGCSEEDRVQLAGIAKQGWSYYTIQFHTNGRSDNEWVEKNQSQIRECEAILGSLNGSCQVNGSGTPGCVVSVTLPGKQSK
jgi:hypothetical protein